MHDLPHIPLDTKRQFVSAIRERIACNYLSANLKLDSALTTLIEGTEGSISKAIHELTVRVDAQHSPLLVEKVHKLENALFVCLVQRPAAPPEGIGHIQYADMQLRCLRVWLDERLRWHSPVGLLKLSSLEVCTWVRWHFWDLLLNNGSNGADMPFLVELEGDHCFSEGLARLLRESEDYFLDHHALQNGGIREPVRILRTSPIPFAYPSRVRRVSVRVHFNLGSTAPASYMFIDTGAPISVMTKGTVDRLFPGATIKPSPVPGEMLGPFCCMGTIDCLIWLRARSVQTREQIFVPFAFTAHVGRLVEEKGTWSDLRMFDILLGQDVMEPRGIDISSYQRQLVLRKDGDAVVPFEWP